MPMANYFSNVPNAAYTKLKIISPLKKENHLVWAQNTKDKQSFVVIFWWFIYSITKHRSIATVVTIYHQNVYKFIKPFHSQYVMKGG